MWAPFAGSTLCLEAGFPFRIGDLFDFPYRECWPVLATMVEKIGPARLLWGTDMPFQNRFCTYRQSRDYIEKYSKSYLNAEDLAKVMGGNCARILGIDSSAT
jgi:predicted TIM-barrel fold metal-dependent hydrolase